MRAGHASVMSLSHAKTSQDPTLTVFYFCFSVYELLARTLEKTTKIFTTIVRKERRPHDPKQSGGLVEGSILPDWSVILYPFLARKLRPGK
jgi:hypothetical protein